MNNFRKNQRSKIKFCQGSVTVSQKMANYQEAKVKVKIKQINKLKPAAKTKTETVLRINKENFQDEELSHELFLK